MKSAIKNLKYYQPFFKSTLTFSLPPFGILIISPVVRKDCLSVSIKAAPIDYFISNPPDHEMHGEIALTDFPLLLTLIC